jgi:hypothetical protein
VDGEGTSRALPALDFDVSAVSGGNPRTYRQAESTAALCASVVDPIEAIEDCLLFFQSYSYPRVGHSDHCPGRRRPQ